MQVFPMVLCDRNLLIFKTLVIILIILVVGLYNFPSSHQLFS
jgi:hypothetical protein